MLICSESTEGFNKNKSGACAVSLDEVRAEWKSLWIERFEDKVKAESIANKGYSLLFVERGTVIAATRDYKQLDLKEILKQHVLRNDEEFLPPHPTVGGWGKFARTVLNRQKRYGKWEPPVRRPDRQRNLQLKSGGRGWLHICRRKNRVK